MRTVVFLFLLLSVGVVVESVRFERGAVIQKEELRSLPEKIRQERLAMAVYDLVEEVIRYATLAKVEFKRTICDSNQFFADDELKEFSDDEIVGCLQSYLVDSRINITRAYSSHCTREGYTTKPNGRILLVEW
jgi:site-specific recombinase XerD